ncbi:hypothetical protein QTP70_004761 [Hemibagrus guttatus]|uniref:GPI ethanolamine phosphate transferase 2 n=1 Tax=Hemibagrus guttatus TaxID=175788 RepID=A0AAE0QWV5_9TELE|nr:hypothetical protein QTP70_004761 [Hemibagrus guttatus]KAK3563983.1 hypothetical protein QTP86_006229 [Hemibagrus guttatus]
MKLSSSVFSALCLIIELLGIALFLRGFFPVPIKSSLSSNSKLSDLPAEPVVGSSPNSTKVPPPLFNKVVIVLIDALRDDFVFGPNGKRFMPYTRNLVESGSSHGFIAKARPPTVTMPRIKYDTVPVYKVSSMKNLSGLHIATCEPLPKLEAHNSSVLQRALTSTPLEICGINWNSNCMPGLLA